MRHLPRASSAPNQTEIPIQPVARPILCSPFAEPERHWVYDDKQTGEVRQEAGRRSAFYWYKTQRTGSAQLALLVEEERDDLEREQQFVQKLPERLAQPHF